MVLQSELLLGSGSSVVNGFVGGLLCFLLCSGSGFLGLRLSSFLHSLGGSFYGFLHSFCGLLQGSGLGIGICFHGVGGRLCSFADVGRDALYAADGIGDGGDDVAVLQLLGILGDELGDDGRVGCCSCRVAGSDVLRHLLGNRAADGVDLLGVGILELVLQEGYYGLCLLLGGTFNSEGVCIC